MNFFFQNKLIETDVNGYLRHLDDWSEPLAHHLASLDQLQLGPEHFEVIYILRDFYSKYKATPVMRILVKAVERQLGREKGNSRYLYTLFPNGPARQASKYAGLPRPAKCM